MRHLPALLLSVLGSALPMAAQAAANVIGAGCPGSNGPPTLTANQGPWLGEPCTLTLTNLPTVPGLVWWMWGFDDTSWAGQRLPVDFAFAGAPGCMLYLRPEHITFEPQPLPTLSATFPVPVRSSLIGCRLLCQVLVCDSGINRIGYTSTNGLELLFDQRP